MLEPFAAPETEDPAPDLAACTRVTYLNQPLTVNKRKILPNLLVLFARPVDLPRVRPWTWLTPRGLLLHRPHGRLGHVVDGVFLRVDDSKAAVSDLTAAGAAHVARPGAWLREHRGDRFT